MIRETVQLDNLITAIFPLRPQDTYASVSSGATTIAMGRSGTSMVRTTCKVFKSTTATSEGLSKATRSHRPSCVEAVPYPVPGSGIQAFTLLVPVSMTANRGFIWSAVKTLRSSAEIEMRSVFSDMGMMAMSLRAWRSSTDTVPGPTLET